MPRIEASNIEEHVRRQTERILDAARRLFHERGYRRTDIGDIAAEVGLARNSLYRYYPNKDHILVACIQRDMGPFMEQVEALNAVAPDAQQRIVAWLDLQVDLATSPAHATLELISEIRDASPALRREIMRLHEAPNSVLHNAVTRLLKNDDRNADLIASMIASLAQSASLYAMEHGDVEKVKHELRQTASRLLDT